MCMVPSHSVILSKSKYVLHMPFALYKVHTDQLLNSLLSFCEPYNSSPLASTDVIAKSQGFVPFTHFANSTGLSGQCSKGPQDSLQEISWGELRQRSSLQGGEGSYALASNNLDPYPVPTKCSKPNEHNPERSVRLLFVTFSIITFIMGVGDDVKLF